MKNQFGAILAVVAGLVVVSSSLNAQGDLCTPDCLSDAWSAPKTMNVSLAPEYPYCYVEVEYVERTACGLQYDFQFTGKYRLPNGVGCEEVWDILTGDGYGPWENLMQLIHWKASIALMTDRINALPDNDKPRCPVSVLQFRVMSGQCVAKHLVAQGEGWSSYWTERCSPTCCLKLFMACYDETTGQVSVTERQGEVNPPCPTQSSGEPSKPCRNVCYE